MRSLPPLPPLAVGLLGLVLAAVWLGLQPPGVVSRDAPEDRFSAGRAAGVLGELLAEGVPHPVGSAANARVGERILSELREIGYQPTVQETWACRAGSCAPVRNIVARLPGRQPGPAVMLAVHYDGVPAGPGAADDGAGVAATLEIARILRREAPFRTPIVFLIDEGEEGGLLGAEAFVTEHPLADSIGVVVNLEARGSRGPSLMFETSEGNARLIEAYAEAVPRPNTSSLFFEAYRRLPNDTDLTVFKRHGMQGMGFGFIDGVAHYHTPLDDLRHLDRRSLQGHGDNALSLVRRLADSDLAAPKGGNAVYTDIFSLVLLRWPAAATLPWALFVLLLLAGAAWLSMRRGRARVRELGWGVLLWILVPVSAAAWAWLVGQLLSALRGTAQPWWAYPLPFRVTLWSGALLAAAVIGGWIGRRGRAPGLLLGVWLVWGLLGVGIGWSVPGVSYLFLLPATVAALALCAALAAPRRSSALLAAGALGALAVAGTLWFRLTLGLESAFGLGAGVLIAAVLGIALTPLAPLFAVEPRQWTKSIAAATGLVALVAAVGALLVPVRTADWPQPANLLLVEDADSGTARWVVSGTGGETPSAITAAAAFDRAAARVFPWSEQRLVSADAPPTGARAPALTELRSEMVREGRVVRGRFHSPRGAYGGEIYLPADGRLREVRIGGRRVDAPVRGRFHALRISALPPEGAEVELTLAGAAPIQAILVDRSPGLAPGAAAEALLQARSGNAYTPVHGGDATVVVRRVAL